VICWIADVPWDSYNWGRDGAAIDADADDAADQLRADRRARSLECADGTCGGCPRCGWPDDQPQAECLHTHHLIETTGRRIRRICADCGESLITIRLRTFGAGILHPFRLDGDPVSAAEAARIFKDV
jgi:hypothetical protein